MPKKSKDKVEAKIQEKLSIIAPTRAIIPPWEDPIHRFFEGWGELKAPDQNGRAFTIWEAVLYFSEREFPIWVVGTEILIEREDLLLRVILMLTGDPDAIPVSEGEKQKLRDLVRSMGFDIPDPNKIE
jgi:hypothetical protein